MSSFEWNGNIMWCVGVRVQAVGMEVSVCANVWRSRGHAINVLVEVTFSERIPNTHMPCNNNKTVNGTTALGGMRRNLSINKSPEVFFRFFVNVRMCYRMNWNRYLITGVVIFVCCCLFVILADAVGQTFQQTNKKDCQVNEEIYLLT